MENDTKHGCNSDNHHCVKSDQAESCCVRFSVPENMDIDTEHGISKGEPVGKIETESERLRKMYVKKAMDENYAKYLVRGGMYLTGLNIWTDVVYFTLAVTHLPLLMAAVYLARGDLVVVAESLHFVMLLLLLLTVTVNCLYEREKIDNIYEALGKKYYDYEDTLDPVSQDKITQSYTESSWRLEFIYRCFTTGVSCALVSIMLGRPLLQYYLQNVIKIKKLPDGVNGSKNTFLYYPWDSSNTWMNMFGYFLQDVYTLILANQVMGYCMMFYTVSEFITVQLETLQVSLSRIKFRAAHLARLDVENPETDRTEEFRKAMHICFKHSIKHHQAIIRVFEDLKDISYLSLLWIIVGLTFLLCLSAALFTSDASIISKGVFASFLLTELLMTFLQCWYGEWFAGTSSDLPWELYSSEWYTISQDMLIYHRMLAMRCTRPLQLSAGGFTKISRRTFLEVIKTAFSYTNLLQASNSRKITSDN